MHNNTAEHLLTKRQTVLQAAAGKAGAGAMAIVDNRQSAPLQAKKMQHTPPPIANPYGNARAAIAMQQVMQFAKNNEKKVAKKKGNNSNDEDFVLPQGKKQQRFTLTEKTRQNVILNTAHLRKHVNKNYKNIYTCPGCRRPLGAENEEGKFEFTKFTYISKRGKKHTQVSSSLDHYPPWAPRERALKSRNATYQEMKEDYNDVDQLRALCKKCNESHKYENKKTIKYESDTDEEGYFTPDDEPENKGKYSMFRYDKDDPPGNGGGITA